MAKIEWEFQDEVVNYPNRYIATNVATNEQITFDLRRGGDVVAAGTPLNAENLNQLIAAINGAYGQPLYEHNLRFRCKHNENDEGSKSIFYFTILNTTKDALTYTKVVEYFKDSIIYKQATGIYYDAPNSKTHTIIAIACTLTTIFIRYNKMNDATNDTNFYDAAFPYSNFAGVTVDDYVRQIY